jgi:hypothetical protein
MCYNGHMPKITTVPKGTKGAFNVYGGCEEFLYSKDHQVFLYGGAGSGKTTAGTLKMAMLCIKYPGVKFLFTRKSYRSLVKSGVETFERVIKELGLSIGKRPDQIRRHGDAEPREFTFPHMRNTVDGKVYEGRSRIVLASLDRVYDEMGAEYDFIYVNQPEQITEQDWQFLATRANGRRGASPYPQLFGDPNPDHERHWIKLGGYQLIDGRKVGDGDRWRLIKSTYHDNPVIWDPKADAVCPFTGKPGAFTKTGAEQIGRLQQSLNPVMVKRMIDAEWASFEGLVYGDVWDRTQHLWSKEKFDKIYGGIQDHWKRYWAVDFGYDQPFVCSMFAKHPDQELYVRYKLIYMSQKTVVEHAQTIRNHTIGDPLPVLIVADRNQGEINILQQELGLNIVPASKGQGSIQTRTDVIAEMLKKNQLLFLDDSVVEEDKRLVALKKPIGFENEVYNLRWDDATKRPEARIDGQDDEENAIGYLFSHIKAHERRIKFTWI